LVWHSVVLVAAALVAVPGIDGEEKNAQAAGCEDYVTKPFSPRQLLAKIRQYLS
jgi:two-component system, cell cycle response regulator DivK